MFLNFEVFNKSGLNTKELFLLLAIHNKALSNLSKVKEDSFLELEEKGLICYVQKGNSIQEKARLTNKSKEILSSLSKPTIDDDDKKVFEWLKDFYIKSNKQIGNASNTLRYISEFKTKSGIERNNLIILCKSFLKDEENMKYNNILEYAFFKPSNAFQKKFSLDGSRLYQFYIKHQEYFNKVFDENNKN